MRIYSRKCLILIFLLSDIITCQAQIIPNDRRIEWIPGIPGGIHYISNPVVNVLNYGADNMGLHDSYYAIIQAIDDLPESGGVVYFPAGSYRVNTRINITRDNIVFRGNGAGESKLYLYTDDNSIEVIIYEQGDWQIPVSGYNLHSKTITVENGSLFTVGEFAEIQQENDPVVMYTNPEWDQDWSENSVGQLLEVASIQGNVITFTTSFNFSYQPELNPVIRPIKLVKNIGFENLYFEKMVAGGSTFFFQNASYCWLRGVESYHTRECHVDISRCLGMEIRECFFHRSFDYGGGGSGYGVNCSHHTSGCLIENNVFDSLRHAMLVQVGASGNVFGYNYSLNPIQGSGEINLNQGWIPPDVSIHGHYPYMNLFEGNYVNEIGIGDYWGPAGRGNTYFRNRVIGKGITYHDYSHYQNLLGNVSTTIDNSDGTSEYMLEHGNVINSVVEWKDSITDHNLPESYYLDHAPQFFDGYNWPVYGPETNPDNRLPAQDLYENWPQPALLFLDRPGDPGKMQLNIRPNPAYERVQIEWDGNFSDECQLVIYNVEGVEVDRVNIKTEKGIIHWGIPDEASPGLYFVSLISDIGMVNRKLFIF